jgi:transcriptional regulator with XRE-family HTH domain
MLASFVVVLCTGENHRQHTHKREHKHRRGKEFSYFRRWANALTDLALGRREQMATTPADPVATLREFREYFASTYEANNKLAARIGVRVKTFSDWLAGKYKPNHDSLAKLRAFLDAEARRTASDGIRPIERVPLKIVLPLRKLHYARLCPFCRKTRGKIRSVSRKQFQGVCPKCGATGPVRESQQEAMRAWNGRE